jgi:predicted lipoprotein
MKSAVTSIDWNWANAENIRIGLVFAVLAQWKFLYYIDRFDHIKANKS